MSTSKSTPFLTSLAHHAADPFRLLVESVLEYAIFILDPAGNVASWNPGAERIYGYASEEIVGRHIECFYTPQDAAEGKPATELQRARKFGSCEMECQRVRRDGSTFWAITTISDLKDYFGAHAGFAKVTRDVTERKEAEAQLRRERDLSDAILSSLPGVYYMYDENGRFVRWNRQFEIVTEYTADEICKIHPLDLFAGDEKDLLARKIESVFRDGRNEVEAHFVSKSGKRTPYHFNGVRAVFDGRPYLLGMGIDVTNSKRAQEALRASDQRMRLAAAAANVGLWDWDMVANQVYYSPEWKRQIGFEEHELSNDWKEWQDRVHPDDLEPALERLRAFLADPSRQYEAEFRLRHRDGSYRTIHSQGSLMFDELGKPIRMLGSHIDVTQQRRVARQLEQSQRLEAIGQLAGGVAHDFNNLLTVINGYSDVLLEQLRPDDPSYEALYEIHRAGEQAGSLTRQLLAFGRQQILEPKILDLNAVVADIEKMLRRLIGEDVLLAVSKDKDLGRVKADPGQIEQILVNLAVNARDAMSNGGSFTIETHNVVLDETYCRALPDVQPGEYVLLAVSDTGCGMDEATKARIFEPFFTTKGFGKGTGLGLATVHGIVKQSRGHVAVYSEPGRGTAFKVYLPRVYDAPSQAEKPVGAGAMPAGVETLLLVEDNDSVRALARHVLRSCGYRILEASNGVEALRLVDSLPGAIHLLVSDVVLPHLGGRELAELIVSKRPGCKLLFLSGYADDAIVRHGVLDAGFAFLQKPFAPSVLAQKVRSLLDEPGR